VFRCTNSVQVRVTHFRSSLYILDFIDNDGSRIEGRTGLVVFAGKEYDSSRSMMKSFGGEFTRNPELEIYMLHQTYVYEICLDGKLLKTVSFRITTTVHCL
jgi:hypothetical protein